MSRVPILTFHSIDDSGSPISFSPRDFARSMRQLARAGWQGCTLSHLLDQGGRDDGVRRIGLSFDDGYRNALDEAAPVLRDLGFAATVFVIAGRCGGDNRWPGQADWVPPMPLLDWPDLSALCSSGWEVGGHGLHHVPLTLLDPARVANEIQGGKDRIETLLGSAVSVFAYPYGAHDADVRAIAAESYRGAFTDRLALADRADLDRPIQVPRVDAYYVRRWPRGPELDRRLARLYLAARRAARRLRRLPFDEAALADIST